LLIDQHNRPGGGDLLAILRKTRLERSDTFPSSFFSTPKLESKQNQKIWQINREENLK